MKAPEGDAEPLLTIVVPAYNEARNIRSGVLTRLAEYLASRPYTHEVVVADDGSVDETAELIESFCAERPSFRLMRNEHGGKAHCVIAGLMEARGRHVMFMDMDLATSLEHVDGLVEALEGSADVVIASREAKGAKRLGAPLSRRFLGKAFNLVIQALLLPGYWDTQCGFKGFRREVARDLVNSLVVFKNSAPPSGPRVTAFDVELLVVARERRYRIDQLPVTWRHVKTPRVNLIRESSEMLRELLSIWWARLRGKYASAPEQARHESPSPGKLDT
jgi:glycosyltransferase involved in cell wall biosynthesis